MKIEEFLLAEIDSPFDHDLRFEMISVLSSELSALGELKEVLLMLLLQARNGSGSCVALRRDLRGSVSRILHCQAVAAVHHGGTKQITFGLPALKMGVVCQISFS